MIVGVGGALVWQQGWPAACARLVLRRETGLVGSSVSGVAAPGGGRSGAWRRVPSYGASRFSWLCGQQDGLRGRHSWCWSSRAPSQILA